ncbi:hypothetical protein V8C86DRAFT_2802086 [Haematococcus lacustris]
MGAGTPWQLSAGFVGKLTASCPLLENLMLDQCDLEEKGVRTVHDPYSPLQRIMVARCRYVETALCPQSLAAIEEHAGVCPTGEEAHSAGGADDAASRLRAVLRRRIDADVMVHDLLASRTHVLPHDTTDKTCRC